MRYWWVNQKQTFAQELEGGYLWSPKRKSNDYRNPYYEFMRAVAPGDVVFSYSRKLILAISIAQSTAYEAPKPPEFGTAGRNWHDIGWKISVQYFKLRKRICPSDYMNRLGPLLPKKYARLLANGFGNRAAYLTTLPDELALELIRLIGREAHEIVNASRTYDEEAPQLAELPVDVIEWEDHLAIQITQNKVLPDTDRKAVFLARRGQGIFKQRVRLIEKRCWITGVERPEHLIASHCKPWRDCDSHDERLNGENGLLLTPSIDHLFDRGLISFEDRTELLISPVAHRESLQRMGVPTDRIATCGTFTQGQRVFLGYHRERVFLQVRH